MASRLRTRLRRPSAPLIVLGALFAAGIALRAALLLAWRPAFLGYSDTGVYLESAHYGPFYSPFWPGGYAMFLTALHWATTELATAALLQHAMGLGMAAMLYAAARRLGAGPWASLAPAAVLLLGGAQILFEHAILSEPVWGFTLAAAAYLTARAITTTGRRRLVWAAAAGLLVATSMIIRVSGLFLILPLALGILLLSEGSWGPRAATLAAAAVPCLIVLAIFQVVHHDSTGRWGFTANGGLNFYARVAPWADCTKFDPPAGTSFLCERTPPPQRTLGHQAYVFLNDTPAVRHFHLAGGSTGGLRPLPPDGARAISRWSRAAVLGEPTTYLRAVGRELARIVDPDIAPGLWGQTRAYGANADLYRFVWSDPPRTDAVAPILRRDWPGTSLVRGDVGFFYDYEKATRAPPLLMIVLIVLALAAPLTACVAARPAAWFFLGLTVAILVFPIAVADYDWRFVVPGLPYLAAAAAIGVEGIVQRLASRRRPASGDPT